ncbi:MAG: hypothetical protein HND27_07485 [Bacteroidetes bacterium]|nr:hypothetical protein [Bacteroidota bacterium]MBV6461814.1 hypothetical protein [Flavobacteriales bacterium]WKZ75928.1 MAG: hypothetical protein QY303_03340 [Vicingaceae bacterium]MCL4816692.1 hypothetical protein [Flavobacteriales bacterium]NOG95606.1 hypothetical protein [Bacteroidota bacterium]
MKTHLLYSIATVFTFSVTAVIVNTSINTLSEGLTYRKIIKTHPGKIDNSISSPVFIATSVENDTISAMKITDSIVRFEVKPPLYLWPIEKTKEIFYAVQVGIYKPSALSSKIKQFENLNEEKLSHGLVRYSYGKYTSFQEAENARVEIIKKGILDAFITAYINGKRLTISQLNLLEREMANKNYVSKKRSFNRNIISFTEKEGKAEIKKIVSTSSAPMGTVYTLVLGEYKDFVPNNNASVFLRLKKWGLKSIEVGEKTFYCLGTLSSKAEAEFLKEEVSEMGIENAKIINYSDDILLCLK